LKKACCIVPHRCGRPGTAIERWEPEAVQRAGAPPALRPALRLDAIAHEIAELKHRPVRQAVEDEQSILAAAHKAERVQQLQVLRDIRLPEAGHGHTAHARHAGAARNARPRLPDLGRRVGARSALTRSGTITTRPG